MNSSEKSTEQAAPLVSDYLNSGQYYLGPLLDEFIERFVEGKLLLDCSSITLTQCSEDKPEVIKGRGMIVPNREGFSLRMYPDDGADPNADIRRAQSWVPGKRIPSAHYFKLEALDLNDFTWTCESFMPKRHGHGPIVITGSIPTLTCREKCPQE